MSDSNLPDNNPLLLYELFLSGTISPEEAQTLCRLIEEDSLVGSGLCKNAFIDFLLEEDADCERRTRQADQEYLSDQDS
ncbi:MAG: hypothetical protein Q4G59_12270, partial [Planctomycetia bacterium]|nr:hypothetical protein [Planctomycetia bacterium]